MENNFNTPDKIVEANINGAVNKANLPLGKMILLGILAGGFIAFGGAASSLAVHGIQDMGLAKMLAGVVFPVGLMMIVLVGGELFTGNCLIAMAVLDKKTTWAKMGRNLAVVYVSNMAGALLVTGLLYVSGQWNCSSGGLGAYTIKVALGKAQLNPVTAVASGILCNILVCVAILMAGAAKDVTGKLWAVFFPICAFVICGFEHCVANMYYLPAGILALSNAEYAQKAQELYGLTATELGALNPLSALGNLIPVTLGNIIGGAVLIGVVFWTIHRKGRR